MITAATLNCPRCEMPIRRGVTVIDKHVGICRCGVIFTDCPVDDIDRFVQRQARALTMAWAVGTPWPWSPQAPPQAATCAPSGEDA